MRRNILTVCGGIILSFLLLAFSGWFFAEFSYIGKISGEYALGKTIDFKALSKSMEIAYRIIDYIIFPTGALFIGTFVGLLSKSREVVVTAVTLLPLVILATSTDSSRLSAFLFAFFYLTIGCLTTHFISIRKKSGRPSSEISSNDVSTPNEREIC